MSTASDRKAKIQAAAPQQRTMLPWIAAVLVLLLVAGGIAFALLQNKNKSDDTAASLANVTAPPNGTQAKDGIVVNPGKAASGAPVVALFQDYQCPACKHLEDLYGPALEELASSGKIQLQYHTMTFLDSNLRNDASTRAAEAAACSDVVGSYAKYHDTIYKNQPTQEGQGYTDDQLRKTFPEAAGITGDKLSTFTQCVTNRNMKNWVVGTNDAAGKAGITSTPTIKVNGKDFQLQGITGVDDFKTKLLAAGK